MCLNEQQKQILKLLWDFNSLREEHIIKLCKCSENDINFLIARNAIKKERNSKILSYKNKEINNRNVVAFDVVMQYLKRNPKIKKGKFPVNVVMQTEQFDYDIIAVKEIEVETLYEKCKEETFSNYRVEYIHGKMRPKEKDKIMERFKNKEIDILISTTVIEVGVDVPNANIMGIENAERFGLAQLHQLRGRVGRGEYKSYCVLKYKGKGQNTKERMKIMCETNDGFLISQKDLENESGVSVRSISRLEQGASVQLESLIKILTALNLDANLDLLIPDQTKRPSFYLEDSRKPKQRVRKKERSNDNFKWGDEK